jgi:hypothetical protein
VQQLAISSQLILQTQPKCLFPPDLGQVEAMSAPQELTQELTPVVRALQQHLLAQGEVLPKSVNLQQALAFAQQSATGATALPETGSDAGDTDTDNEDAGARRSSERLAKGKQGAGKGAKDKAGVARVSRQEAKEADAGERAKGGKAGKGGAAAAKDSQPPRKKVKAEAPAGDGAQVGQGQVSSSTRGHAASGGAQQADDVDAYHISNAGCW